MTNRITFLVGKRFSDLTNYRQRMGNQPYFVGDDDIDRKSRLYRKSRLTASPVNQTGD